MALIETKCPECGATLKISDQAAGELTCPYCGSKYLAEKVTQINNVSNNIVANEVVINNERNYKDFQILLMKRSWTDSKGGLFWNDKHIELYIDDTFFHVLELDRGFKFKLDISKQHVLHLRIGEKRHEPLIIEKDETRMNIGVYFNECNGYGVLLMTFVDNFSGAQTRQQFDAMKTEAIQKAQRDANMDALKIFLMVFTPIMAVVLLIVLSMCAYISGN